MDDDILRRQFGGRGDQSAEVAPYLPAGFPLRRKKELLNAAGRQGFGSIFIPQKNVHLPPVTGAEDFPGEIDAPLDQAFQLRLPEVSKRLLKPLRLQLR